VRRPHFDCNSSGLQRTRCSSEQLDQLFHTLICQWLPLLEQPCIGGTLRHGILDKSLTRSKEGGSGSARERTAVPRIELAALTQCFS